MKNLDITSSEPDSVGECTVSRAELSKGRDMAETRQTTVDPGSRWDGGGPAVQMLLAEVRGPEVTERMIDPRGKAMQVRGELDLATVGRLEARLDPALAGNSSPLLIDFTGCGFMDSSVVALLINLRVRLGNSDPAPRFAVVAQGQPLRLLLLTGVDQMIPVCASVPEALGALEDAEPSGASESNGSAEARFR